ncbi:MAG: hypothetical protein ACR2JF_15435 [Iamia sp.]
MTTKTSVEVNRELARSAGEILGTTTLRATIDAALRDVVDARQRLEALALLGEQGRFDFSSIDRAWGGDHE